MSTNEMITQLPTVTSAQLSDIIYAVQGYVSPASPGLSVQETLQQVFNLMLTQTILSNAGNPNAVVAGNIYQLLWDTVDNLLWVCTTTGSATTAVWKPCVGQLTNGQLLIGSTGVSPVAATLTGGTGIAISNAAGSITISTSGAGTGWTDVTSATQGMLSNNGYIADRGAGNVAFTLPVSSAIGDTIYVVGKQNGWSVGQAASQQIIIGSSSTTIGAGGSTASTNSADTITLICTTANLKWTANAVQGNITIV